MYCIYCYTNKITGKKYVGQTCQSLEKRAGKNGYKYRRCTVFWKAIQKYGWENFEVEILEDGLTLKQANEREQYWISQLNTLTPNGYNCAIGGMNVSSSDYVKQKISKAKKGRKASPEAIEKNRQSHLGILHSPEAKEKISQKLKGKPKHYTEEGKQKLIDSAIQRCSGSGNPMYGKHHSDESKEKNRQSHLGKKSSPEAVEKTRQKNLNRPDLSRPVLQYTKDGVFIKEWPSICEIRRELGYNAGSICYCCLNKPEHKTAYGCVWKYKEVV